LGTLYQVYLLVMLYYAYQASLVAFVKRKLGQVWQTLILDRSKRSSKIIPLPTVPGVLEGEA
jgi:hypothetical protein